MEQCKNPIKMKRLEVELTNYLALKDILEAAEKEK